MQHYKILSNQLLYKVVLFIGLGLILLATACGSRKTGSSIPLVLHQTIHDTVTVTKTVTERDTVFITKVANTNFKVDLKDLKEGFKSGSQNKNAIAGIKVSDGKLEVDCTCDSLSIYAKIRDQITEKDRQRIDTKTILKTEHVPYIPWYIKSLAWIGGIGIVIIVGRVLLKKLKILK
ncbi:hypothetical protein KO02_16400 [Sphingobacterium sp. ML3W]|uniref:hypothetical protein n=1 Tax=Sphingobacterium sp. ML3W TaxID=1538644 RepID=UPI0004F82BF6|nr:hypothetical protein [Sphingobacterium sp. ML3W]AIM38088.1 hypothetical protein KO02_16400 [Sphingobacterium sp. ML3W]